MTNFGQLIHALTDGKVDFVVIGGVALVSRGGSRLTNDLSVVYSRTPAGRAKDPIDLNSSRA